MTSEVTEKKVHLGIPQATFIEDVDAYLKAKRLVNVEEAMKEAEEQYSKYKMMEQSLLARKNRFKVQIPDIAKNLEVINYLKEHQEPFDTTFEVADQLYARANIDSSSKVGLWLGANVMLEYGLDEARALLKKNHDAASGSLAELEGNIDFLKDQITTTEVNMARLYNLNVIARRQQK